MKKILSFVLTLVTLVSSLSGCTVIGHPEPTEKPAVCFIIANTANSKGLNFNSPLVRDTVYNTIRNYGFIAIVNADGEPEMVHAASYNIDDRYKAASKERLDMDARSKATGLINAMSDLIADDPEIDYMLSLNLASRALADLEGYTTKSIIMIGTGVSTTGVLDFNNNLLSGDPQKIVELLAERSEIPDFSGGITVYSQQLGDVAAPQEELSSAQRKKLEKIYSGIVEAGGGEFICNNTIANPVDETKTYPTVTPVQLPIATPIVFDDVSFEEEEEDFLEEPIILPEETIEFEADTDVFVNEAKTREKLKPIADILKRTEIRVLLAGTTAGDTDSAFTIALSERRAEALKKLLVEEYKISEDRILTIGLGSENDPWHIVGEEDADQQNRKVVLLDASSEEAAALLGSDSR